MKYPKQVAARVATRAVELGVTVGDIHESRVRRPAAGTRREYLVPLNLGSKRGLVRVANFDRDEWGVEVHRGTHEVSDETLIADLTVGSKADDAISLIGQWFGTPANILDAAVKAAEDRALVTRRRAATVKRHREGAMETLLPGLVEAVLRTPEDSQSAIQRALAAMGLGVNSEAMLRQRVMDAIAESLTPATALIIGVDTRSVVPDANSLLPGMVRTAHVEVVSKRLAAEVLSGGEWSRNDLRALALDAIADYPLAWRQAGAWYVDGLMSRLRFSVDRMIEPVDVDPRWIDVVRMAAPATVPAAETVFLCVIEERRDVALVVLAHRKSQRLMLDAWSCVTSFQYEQVVQARSWVPALPEVALIPYRNEAELWEDVESVNPAEFSIKMRPGAWNLVDQTIAEFRRATTEREV